MPINLTITPREPGVVVIECKYGEAYYAQTVLFENVGREINALMAMLAEGAV